MRAIVLSLALLGCQPPQPTTAPPTSNTSPPTKPDAPMQPPKESTPEGRSARGTALAIQQRVLETTRWGYWEKSLIVTLPERTKILSTNEGFVEADVVVNHSADPDLWTKAFQEMHSEQVSGGDAYLAEVETRLASALNVDKGNMALVATAADMDNLAVVTKAFAPFEVTALVTAGAKSNAHRAGTDEGRNIESVGTVNILLLVNAQFTDGAQTGAVIIATEAKTAAFQDLNVPSSYTPGAQATGTGTDTVVVVPANHGPRVTYAGAHAKVGELIAKATYQAVREALIKQDGRDDSAHAN